MSHLLWTDLKRFKAFFAIQGDFKRILAIFSQFWAILMQFKAISCNFKRFLAILNDHGRFEAILTNLTPMGHSKNPNPLV